MRVASVAHTEKLGHLIWRVAAAIAGTNAQKFIEFLERCIPADCIATACKAAAIRYSAHQCFSKPHGANTTSSIEGRGIPGHEISHSIVCACLSFGISGRKGRRSEPLLRKLAQLQEQQGPGTVMFFCALPRWLLVKLATCFHVTRGAGSIHWRCKLSYAT
jgi:hypothetical protein